MDPLIPAPFAATLATRPGGTAWLETLPALIGDLLARWNLRVDGPSAHGNVGVVVPVRRDGLPLALKISRPSPEVDNQITALKAWDRRGTRSNGSVFTVESLGRYHLHDVVHHLWDVRWVGSPEASG